MWALCLLLVGPIIRFPHCRLAHTGLRPLSPFGSPCGFSLVHSFLMQVDAQLRPDCRLCILSLSCLEKRFHWSFVEQTETMFLCSTSSRIHTSYIFTICLSFYHPDYPCCNFTMLVCSAHTMSMSCLSILGEGSICCSS